MRNKKKYIFLIIPLVMIYCQNDNKDKPVTTIVVDQPSQQELSDGFQLLQTSCFSCHSPNAAIENRIAPTMMEIKEHYINSNITQREFTIDLNSFLDNPSKEKSKMPSAIERYNLMPKMNLSEKQISNIASYMYNSEIEKPDWFEKHYEEEKQKYSTSSASSPIEIGQKIALKTKGVLGKNLLQAINARGTEGALSFCSTRALSLTDSMAVSLNARIKRVSDKNRNPKNKANESELEYIIATKLDISQNIKPKPQIITIGNKEIAYYPIMTNQMCMQCHGQPKTEVLTNTLVKINSLYPQDEALGYKVNELRGIWVVEMDKK